ncbi:MAG: hypothetical protein GEU71_02125 [Actinobacteria bacterium]|nr:hypothetical protein [Actinomycetota bacterium]
MLAYQVRDRVLRTEPEGTKLRFPNDVEVALHFTPASAFGGVAKKGRTVGRQSEATLRWDANTGRQYVFSATPLDPADVAAQSGRYKVRFRANVFTCQTRVDDRNGLQHLIETLAYVLPPLLNVDMLDSVTLDRVGGSVGGTSFPWELSRSLPGNFEVTTTDEQEQRLMGAWERLTSIEDEDRRIVAALQYFYVACRLERVGSSPWEFLPEIVLNLAKVLEALFPPSSEQGTIDAARQGLQQLGYPADEVDRDFIPAIALRNSLDAGHASLAIFDAADLAEVHTDCERAEPTFREMLRRLLAAAESGTVSLEPFGNTEPSKDVLKVLERIRTANERNP